MSDPARQLIHAEERIAQLECQLADSERIRKAKKELLIQEIAAHAQTKTERPTVDEVDSWLIACHSERISPLAVIHSSKGLAAHAKRQREAGK